MMYDILQVDKSLTLLFNGSECVWLDNFAFYATKTVVWIPLMAALLYVVFKSYGWKGTLFVIFGVALCILIADQVASGICKPYFQRLRPTHNPELMPFIDIVNGYRGGKYGFFSSHASNTFATAAFFTLLLKKRSTSIALVLWALLNCWTRVYLGVHYVSDLLVGAIFGILTGYVIWWLFMACADKLKLRLKSTPDWVVPTTFILTLVVIGVVGAS